MQLQSAVTLPPIDQLQGVPTMAIHKRILEWQAANPTITWIFWIIIWIIVFILLFRPTTTGGQHAERDWRAGTLAAACSDIDRSRSSRPG